MSLYDKQYLDIVDKILTFGYFDSNRTGIDTYKLPHQIMSFDLKEEFPILTSKKVYFKSLTEELLWIWQRQTNDINYLNSKIWDEWADENGKIGKAYGYQISPTERMFEIVKVKKRSDIKVETELKYPLFEIVKPSFDKDEEDIMYSGLYSNNENKLLKIIDIVEKKDSIQDTIVNIQFLYTGYIVKNVRFEDIKNIKDVYAITVCDRGFLGEQDYKNITPEMEKFLYSTWVYMLRNTKKDLDVRWLNFTNFVRDARYLPNWSAKKLEPTEYVIDTNYYCSDVYSKDTCVWLHKQDYQFYINMIPIQVTNKITNKSTVELSLYACVDKYKTSLDDIYNDLLGRVYIDELSHQKREGKYEFKYLLDEEDYVYRYKLPTNQVNKLIKTLKEDNQSRRMLVSLWNVDDLEEMNLEPCAFLTMWDVTDNKLNLSLIIRSNDLGLGNPFNISQYAVLCNMMAHIVGLEPGLFTCFINNAHIYENQLEGINIQREKPQYEAPKLWINPEIKDFYDFTVDDIKLIDYNHSGKVDMGTVAV